MTHGDGTRVVHAGLPDPEQGQPFLGGPVFAAPFHVAGDPASAAYTYGRHGNPTYAAYERALGELEGGEAVVFSSGMAASTAVLFSLLGPGSVVVLPDDCYFTVRSVAATQLAERGIEVRTAPTAGNAQEHLLEGASLLWIETPSNPQLDVCDIAALADKAHAAGALVAVDNTTATPLGQRPLELGADFSVASDTKAMTGHSDVVLGHVAAADPARAQALRAWRTSTGSIPGPMEVWLAHRSLATLDLRLERQSRTALALATLLRSRPEVTDVRYPGLADHPAADVIGRQMRRHGGVLSFTLPSEQAAQQFLSSCRLVTEATSFGSHHTTAERRGRWGGDDVPPGFVRFSTGVEDAADLLDDVTRALDGLASAL
jgi:cystathionine gamma-lyase